METTIDVAFRKRRAIEQALDDLRAQFERRPNPDLGRMIAELEAEIATRAAKQEDARRAH